MAPEEVAGLEPGLYRIHWHPDAGGGVSLAAVGSSLDGTPWLSCCNWLATSNYSPGNSCHWSAVLRAEPILLAKDADRHPSGDGWRLSVMATRTWRPAEVDAKMTEVDGPPTVTVPVDFRPDKPTVDIVSPPGAFERAWANMVDQLTGTVEANIVEGRPWVGTVVGVDLAESGDESVGVTTPSGLGWSCPRRGDEMDDPIEATIDSEFLTPSRHPTCSSCCRPFAPPTPGYLRLYDRCPACRGMESPRHHGWK